MQIVIVAVVEYSGATQTTELRWLGPGLISFRRSSPCRRAWFGRRFGFRLLCYRHLDVDLTVAKETVSRGTAFMTLGTDVVITRARDLMAVSTSHRAEALGARSTGVRFEAVFALLMLLQIRFRCIGFVAYVTRKTDSPILQQQNNISKLAKVCNYGVIFQCNDYDTNHFRMSHMYIHQTPYLLCHRDRLCILFTSILH